MVCHVGIWSLLQGHRNAPKNISKQGQKHHMWKTIFGPSDSIPKGIEKPRKRTPTWNFVGDCSKSRCCQVAWISLEGRLCGQRVWGSALNNGVSLNQSLSSWDPQPFKSSTFVFLFLSDELAPSACLGQPFPAGIKSQTDPLPSEFGTQSL
jgi:hypothetical protein